MTPPATNEAERSRTAAWLKQIRQLHLYLGVFFAPSLLFFAFSGSLQLFGLHEGHPGETYRPPAWIQKLASIHKDQTLAEHHGPPPPSGAVQARRPPEARPNFERRGPGEEHRESKATLALKCFFLAMAAGLIFTTLLGIYMGFRYERNQVLVWGLLLAGTFIPAALIGILAAG